MNDNILSIFTRRCEQAKERLTYSVKPELYKTIGDTDVVLMKKHYGLSKGGELILLPVFDEISISEDGSVFFGRISNFWTMFDMFSGQELVPQSFEDLPVYNYQKSGEKYVELCNCCKELLMMLLSDLRRSIYSSIVGLVKIISGT